MAFLCIANGTAHSPLQAYFVPQLPLNTACCNAAGLRRAFKGHATRNHRLPLWQEVAGTDTDTVPRARPSVERLGAVSMRVQDGFNPDPTGRPVGGLWGRPELSTPQPSTLQCLYELPVPPPHPPNRHT